MRPYLYIRLLGFVLPILATPIPNIGDVGIVVRGEDDKSLGIGVGAVRVKISLK